jgi:hypothetical protein
MIEKKSNESKRKHHRKRGVKFHYPTAYPKLDLEILESSNIVSPLSLISVAFIKKT